MTGTADPVDVSGNDEFHLRRYVEARRRGDTEAMEQHWQAMYVNNYDRIRAQVSIETAGRLSKDERDDALQRAGILHTTRLAFSFEGTSKGEWWNATKTLVHYACMQEQDHAKSTSKHEVSLERTYLGDDGEPVLIYERYLQAEDERRRAAEQDAEDLEAEREAGREFLDWGLPQLSDKLREVAELDARGVPVEQIMEILGLKKNAVYKRRERYHDALDELRKSYEP